VLAGEAALNLPGVGEHPGYPLALAVTAVFAAARADVAGAEELCRQAVDANGRQDDPDWRVEETICAARSSMAVTTGAFAEAARLAQQVADIARAGGDLADACLELTFAVADSLLIGDETGAVPLARDALDLARQLRAPALIATSLLALGTAVAETDPELARACLRESRELSTALGYQSAINFNWASMLTFLVGDHATALELGRRAIDGLRWSSDRIRMGMILHMMAGMLATTRPEAAMIIQGAAQAHAVGSTERIAQLSAQLAAALGEDRARELRDRGADMDWDQAIAYTLTQVTQAQSELDLQPQR
jgi:hypothetical protein